MVVSNACPTQKHELSKCEEAATPAQMVCGSSSLKAPIFFFFNIRSLQRILSQPIKPGPHKNWYEQGHILASSDRSSCSYGAPELVRRKGNFFRFSHSPHHKTTTVPSNHYNIIHAAQGNSCSKQAIEVDVPRKCENIFRLVYLSVLEHLTVLKISLLA